MGLECTGSRVEEDSDAGRGGIQPPGKHAKHRTLF